MAVLFLIYLYLNFLIKYRTKSFEYMKFFIFKKEN